MDSSLYGQIFALLQLLTSFGSVCAMGYALYKFTAKPHASLVEEVAELQKWRADVESRLERGNQRFDDQYEANRVTQSALLALVDKEITDCTTRSQSVPPELTRAKADLVRFLTNKR